MEADQDPIETLITAVLKELGEDPGRSGLQKTPDRVARSLRSLTEGYGRDPSEILNDATFDVSYDEMVLVRDINFYSLCEHHILPFLGRIHVAYVPDGRVIGLSKLPRLVEVFSRRLQVQERLTTQIAETLEDMLKPRGVAVVCESIHLCMMMRGVKQENAFAITSSLRGVFKSDSKTRSEFMQFLRHQKESFV